MCESIEKKIGDLARIYGSSEKFFPLDLIVRSLQLQAIKFQMPSNWAFSILISAGLPYQRLFFSYNKLYMSKDVSFV
jgi:nuclear pore complex protein Nup155